MCGKKLVEGPDFNVGDYVVEEGERYTSGRVISFIEEYTGRGFFGSFYIPRTNEFFDYLRSDSSKIDIRYARHATPEEIAEYKAALNFNNHGRKPFEFRNGDIAKDHNGYKFFLHNPELLDKEDLYRGSYTLLKTAEEVNEWLGASDDK